MKRICSCFVILLLMTATFAACGGSSSYGDYASSSPAQYAAQDSSYAESFEAAEGESTRIPLLTPSNAEGIKLVYTVNLELQTTEFEAGTRKLLNTVADIGGYVQSTYVRGRNLYEDNVERRARYTLQIPSEKLADFLVTMEDNYNLLELEQNSQNISGQYYETASRLNSLREQEERLLSMLRETQDMEEKLELELELSDIQLQIGSLSASAGSMDIAVIYSTVTINLYEVILENVGEIPAEPFSTRFKETTSQSWGGFVAFCQGVVLFVVTILPAVVILAIAGGIALLIWRIIRKRSEKKIGKPLPLNNVPAPPLYQPAQPPANNPDSSGDDSGK